MSQPIENLPDLFRAAAQVVRDCGHGKGEFVAASGAVCTVGALMVAAGLEATQDYEVVHPAGTPAALVDDAIVFLSPRVESSVVDSDPVERVADWNDRPERAASEVVGLLEVAAVAAGLGRAA